jgi:hypothetical protein
LSRLNIYFKFVKTINLYLYNYFLQEGYPYPRLRKTEKVAY